MHQLIIEDSAGEVVVVPLMRDRISVGRGKGNVVRLTDRNVSRWHARLYHQDGQLLVEDLASHLGTRVNGVAIAGPTVLGDGDEVLIGEYRLAIKDVHARLEPVRAWARAAWDQAGTLSARLSSVIAATARALSPENVAVLMGSIKVASGAGGPPLGLAMMTEDPEPAAPAPRPVPPPAVQVSGEISFVNAAPPPAAEAPPVSPPPAEPAPAEPVPAEPPPVAEPSRPEPPSIGLRPLPSLLSAPPPVVRRPLPAPIPSTPAFEALSRSLTASLAQPFPEPPARRRLPRLPRLSGTVLLAGVAAVMVVVAALFVPLLRRDAATSRPITAAAPVPAASPAPASGDGLLAEARRAYRQQRWSEALLIAQRAAPLLPGSRELPDLQRAIVAEHQNQSTLQSLSRSLDLEDYRSVLRGSASIPRGSVYHDRALALAEAARANLVVQHVAAGERSRAEGDCQSASKEAQAALVLEAENPGALALVAACDREAAPPRRTPRRVRVASAPPAAVDRASRNIVQTEPARAAAPASPGEKPSRRPIDPNNPYAADLP